MGLTFVACRAMRLNFDAMCGNPMGMAMASLYT